jgi:hypothetical protein
VSDLRPRAGRFTARNDGARPNAAWAKMRRYFTPPLNLHSRQGLGVWVHGDGQGEVLNVQLRSPLHVSNALGEHYIIIDFTGWRYFELVEPEDKEITNHNWMDYSRVQTLCLRYTHLPPGKKVVCHLSALKALPFVKAKLCGVSLRIADRTLTFPIEIESGSYLEMNSASDCVVYDAVGEQTTTVAPRGDALTIKQGANDIISTCDVSPSGISARYRLTVTTLGDVLN